MALGRYTRVATAFWALIVLGIVAFVSPLAAAPAAIEIRALQQDLAALGLYKGPVDGEMSDEVRAAIAQYAREAGLKVPADRAYRQFGSLVRDVDLETRIRSRAVSEVDRRTVRTRFGDLIVVSYRAETSPPSFIDGRRVLLRGERLDAPLAAFSACCDARVVEAGPADIVILTGSTGGDCTAQRVFIAIEEANATVSDGDGTCAANPDIQVENGVLTLTAIGRDSLLDERYVMKPGKPLVFARRIVPGRLEGLADWVGRPPYQPVRNGRSFFHHSALIAALSAILEPETLGWTLKMRHTQLVERRADLLYVRGSYREDETAVTVTIDLKANAVHACTQSKGLTRYSSTLLKSVFVDPEASCPTNAEEAEAIWNALGLVEVDPNAKPPAETRVFGIEGEFAEDRNCPDRDTTVKFSTRRARGPEGNMCRIVSVGFANGQYQVATSCGTIDIHKIDEDRIEIDGDTYHRCPR